MCTTTSGCFSPNTKAIALNNTEIRAEKIAQKEYVSRYTKKKISKQPQKTEQEYIKYVKSFEQELKKTAKQAIGHNRYYEFKLQKSREINAYADGKQVFVTTGMLDFAESKEELAFILCHELAHNIMAT